MLGQSGYIAFLGSGVTKRLSFLVAEASGMSRREADIFSDELAIAASTTIGTALSVLTCDPVGRSLSAVYTALLEADLAKKRP